MLAVFEVWLRCGSPAEKEHTGGVSQLIILALYPVLERLSVVGRAGSFAGWFLGSYRPCIQVVPGGEVQVTRGARRRGRRIQGPPRERDSRVDEGTAGEATDKQQWRERRAEQMQLLAQREQRQANGRGGLRMEGLLASALEMSEVQERPGVSLAWSSRALEIKGLAPAENATRTHTKSA